MAVLNILILLSWSTLAICISNFTTKFSERLNIYGPSSYEDRIAIVGAGASGIDMARRLKKLGFTSIDIYEKENRVGGKSMTVRDEDGTIQEFGSCCIGPGYENNIMEVIRDYGELDALVPRQFGSVWLDNEDEPIPYPEYVMRELKAHFNVNDPIVAMIKLEQLIEMYAKKHREMFGEYEFEIMPRPGFKILQSLNCSYMDFLKKNRFEGLRPLLLLTHTLQGYGYLDEVAALYGLMWNTPFLMRSLLKLATGQETETRPYLLKSGFQNLWESIAERENLSIMLNSNITEARRIKNGVILTVNGSEITYDFLIWSPELKKSLAVLKPRKKDEWKAFNSTKADFLVSTLIGLAGGRRAPTPTSYWLDNVVKKRNSSVWASRNTKEAFDMGTTSFYNASSYEKMERRFEMAYQYSGKRPCKPLMKVLGHFDKTGVSNIESTNQTVWRYFPHYSSKELTNGVLWDILEMQGRHKTWYIGSSVSFESLKSVLEYNKLLLSLWRPLS